MAINRKKPVPKKKKKTPTSLASPALKLNIRQAVARKNARKKR